jgi:alanine dehydrogenase
MCASAQTGVLLLAASDIERLLDLDTCVAAVESAFRALGEGGCPAPRSLGLHVDGGIFHVKAAALPAGRLCFAAKVNGNFPSNPSRNGLPTVQGLIVLADATNGRPLAVLDSASITTLRTGAATAVAARHLARANSRVATIVGCGVQGRVQLDALRHVLPIERVLAYDRDGCRSDRFASDHPAVHECEIVAVEDLKQALQSSDVVATCTPSREPVLHAGDVRPGTFIAAVGVDNPEKWEIDPRLMAGCTVVVDDLDQCSHSGDLHHALDAGVMAAADVHASLGEVAAGRKPGRTRDDEIALFDSTGIAVQDVAAAVVVFERALASGIGARLAFAD